MGYVANPSGRPGAGFPPQHTLTTLGTLRERGTVDVDQGIMPPSGGMDGYDDEGLGIMGTIRRARARARRADPRRSLALMRRTSAGRFLKPTVSRRGGDAAARARQMAQTRRARVARGRAGTVPMGRRRGIGGIFGRFRGRARARAERARAAAAERAASEAAQIAEAERLARESVTPPPVTDRNGQRWRTFRPPGPPTIHPGPACRAPRPPPRAGGVWQCIRGNWSFQGISTTMPVLKAAPEVMNGAPAPMQPSVRPWWMGQPKDGDIPSRDTSGIPPPPGLPGGPSMRPPPSGRDTATEVVAPEAPAAGMDVAKILPLVAGAALLFLNK